MIKKGLFRLTVAFLYLISLLPFPLLYVLSDILFIILYHIILYRRNVVRDNLSNAFPEKSPAERMEIEKKFYLYFADMIVESIKMFSISQKSIQKRFRFNNISELTRHFKNGKSIIGVTGHYGNWEWGPLITPLIISEPVMVAYKPLTDKNFDGLITKVRSRFGAIMVSKKLTLRKITEFRKQNYALVLVGDQTPSGEELQYFTQFLNQPTAVFLGIEKIAKLTGNPIVYFTIRPYKRGYYECVLTTLVEDPKNTKEYEITEIHTRELERVIRNRPEFWLWSHRRWKFKPEDIKK